MIYVVYHRQKQTCALCTTEIARRTPAMYDPAKSAAKRFVHLTCWEELQRKRGIELEVPPF